MLAYSGARPTEITQLRKEDVGDDGGIPFLRITADAGTVKNSQTRTTPIHDHLIEMGFVDWVKTRRSGPLFADPHRDDKLRAARNVTGRIAHWVRGLGIPGLDGGVSPNHAWRHTFKTKGREAGIDNEMLNAICGQAPGSEGARYGTTTLKAKAEALRRFPRLIDQGALEAPEGSPARPKKVMTKLRVTSGRGRSVTTGSKSRGKP